MSIFLLTFTTLLAIINPLEALPVYLGFVEGKDDATRRSLAVRSCAWALGLMFFFLLFGTLLLKIFGVPISMVRIAGGVILAQLGFTLFSSPSALVEQASKPPASPDLAGDIAFVPMAMPIMFGPGAMATILAMTSHVRRGSSELLVFAEVSAAMVATMGATLAVLLMGKRIQRRLGPLGIDAATRIVGFFVAAIGIGMAFNGVVEALEAHGLSQLH